MAGGGVHQAISTGGIHTVALREDGTVVAAGSNSYSQCDVSGWSDIVAVAAGENHTLGLKSDGTVVVAGRDDDWECYDAELWEGVAEIGAGENVSVALTVDGDVLATGSSRHDETYVTAWNDMVAISADRYCTVGVHSDGSVSASGEPIISRGGNDDIDSWAGIEAVSAGPYHVVGLREDGTVVAVGNDQSGQCDVEDWENIGFPE